MSRTVSGLPQPTGLIQEGSLYSATITSSRYDVRWASAELRTAELLSRIQPNESSEKKRKAVAEYVKGLIDRCFDCKVFSFGSVPLKTYLPDGDIDLTAFSRHQRLKDTWAIHVQSILEREEQRKNAEFCVKEVQCINAEVKVVKCLVENIVVDISFNQLGGLCTLCFLEEVDRQIERDHLFKRSIILVKAWCYYESRLLGAPHGLLSTYALETLVLYIFNVFHTFLRGPLEVLFMFLDYFSNFDWDKYCVSLWGPVPLESIPDLTGEPPVRDGGKLLLSKDFLEACSDAYSVFPKGQDNQSRTFVGKYLNIVDPLRTNNNLGRSVNKASFFRIRSAFSLGARKMAKLFESSDQDFAKHLDNFFSSTWKSHQNGFRRDAPDSSFPPFQPFDYTCQGLHIIHTNRPNDMTRSENKENFDESHSAQKSDLHDETLSESSEVSTSQTTANMAICVIDGDVKIRKPSQNVHSLDSISYGECLPSFSKSLSTYENNKHDNKQAYVLGEVISTNVVECQKKNLLSRTKSLGDSASTMVFEGERFRYPMMRSTSDGRLEDLSYTQVVKNSRLQGDAHDLAVEHMQSVSVESSKNSGNVCSVVEGPKIFRETGATRLGKDSSIALPMKSHISEKAVNILPSSQLHGHPSFTKSRIEKDTPELELKAASSSRNGNLHRNRPESQASLGGQITQNDSRSSTSSRNRLLTTSKHDAQRLGDSLLEPRDQVPASHSHPFSLLSYMPLAGTSTFARSSGIVGPSSLLQMSMGNPSLDSQKQVVPITPTVVAMQGPRGPVSPPVQSYLELPSVAPPVPVLQNLGDTGVHSEFWQQEQELEQEQLKQFRLAGPWSYKNTGATFPDSQEDSELNQHKMDIPSSTGAPPQGSNALAKGRNSLKDSELVRRKEDIEEIKAAKSKGYSCNVNSSADEGLLESSGDAPQESVNRSLVSAMQNFPSHATVTVNRSSVVPPVVPSQSSNELSGPLICGQSSVGHYRTFPSPSLEISSTTENPARGPAVGNNLAPGDSARFVAPGVSFPTFSYYNPFYVTTQGLDHGFGGEVSSEFSSYISHDDDSSTMPDGDHESNSVSRVHYGAGERPKAAGAAGSTGLQFARPSTGETILEPSADLLSSDFSNHRQNLEFGRQCQDPGMCPILYSPSILQPMKYIQAPFYSESLHRPVHRDFFSLSHVPGNMQASIPGPLLSQGYGPLASTFSGPGPGALSVGGDLRKPQTGTGTYLPLRHGSYKDAQLPGVRYQHATYNLDQSRSGNMGSASRRRGMGHRQYNTDGYPQAQFDGAVGFDRHTAEGKLGDRNNWQKGHHLISAYPPVSSNLVVPVSPLGSSNGFLGTNVFRNSPHDPGGLVTLPSSHSPGSALPLGSGQLEFGSFGPVQIGSVPGDFNPGQEVGNIHHSVSTTAGARLDAFPSFPDRGTKQPLRTGQQRTVCTYQLREDDFPPLPLHGQQGGSSIKSNVDN